MWRTKEKYSNFIQDLKCYFAKHPYCIFFTIQSPQHILFILEIFQVKMTAERSERALVRWARFARSPVKYGIIRQIEV